MNHILLTREPIDVGKLSGLVTDESCGAISTFVGTTRDNFNGQKVISLEYEAYEPMALKEICAICIAVRTHWRDIRHIAIYHRLGLVPLREASVVIAISSPHRQAVLEAVTFAIDELKRRVPIWKKEIYNNEQSEWIANKECAWPNLAKFNAKISEGYKFDVVRQTKIDFIPEQLIQISAVDEEVQRRISCFIQKKREEINAYNLKDFMQERVQECGNVVALSKTDKQDDNFSCARTNSFIVKQEHSKGHLRVRRVDNTFGPQTRPNYAQELDKLMSEPVNLKVRLKSQQFSIKNKKKVMNERVNMIAEYVGLTNTNYSHLSIIDRIKDLESRILHLESLSPEYRHFMAMDNEVPKDLKPKRFREFCGNCLQTKSKRKHFTIQQLQNVINTLEENVM